MSNINSIVPPRYDFQKRAPRKASVILLEAILFILFLLGLTLFYYDFSIIDKIEIVENYHTALWVVFSVMFFGHLAALAFLNRANKAQVMHDPPYIIR